MNAILEHTAHIETSSHPRLHALSTSALHTLYQHRVMSTAQLRRLLTPAAQRPVYLLRKLNELKDMGLLAQVRAKSHWGGANIVQQPFLWFLTEAGAEVVEEAGELVTRPYRVTPESVASTRQAHTLAVNEAGLAFFEHARRLAHECGPLDWTPEVAHRIRDGQRRFEDDHVIADAVLRYVHLERGRRTMFNLFLEIDRGTMTTARLAAKVSAYGRLYEYVPQHPDRSRRSAAATRPAWQYTYPVFPRLLVILDADRRSARRSLAEQLAARTEDLYSLTRADPRLMRLASQMSIGVTTLQQLQERGPFEPIFTPLLRGTPEARPAPTDVFLRPPRPTAGSGTAGGGSPTPARAAVTAPPSVPGARVPANAKAPR
ncbi:replication-relaxation family protein [Streptomyces syringium]|uniref:replication-relaxation family protein n=1 Tax=Streptomyces syringium TaxID=76729 RepID=UPI0033CC6B9B